MKKLSFIISLLLIFSLLLSSCNIPTAPPTQGGNSSVGGSMGGTNSDSKPTCPEHTDADEDELCDLCGESIFFVFNLFAFNDLHGVFKDTDTDDGVARLSTYLKSAGENSIILSSGDCWQGSSESNLTSGLIITEWMNEIGVASMTLGNHEFDWGEEKIAENAALAKFPLLAINVYDKDTNARVSYAKPSTMVDLGEIQVGIIGAIGDCYSSISGEVNSGFYFKTGKDLTSLVKDEANRLRAEGADFIVYSLHDGHDKSSASAGYINDSDLSLYYDIELSNGCVDLVFEGHTHKNYIYKDTAGVLHVQGGGYNDALSKVEVSVNRITGKMKPYATTVYSSMFKKLTPDPIVDELLLKYADQIAKADELLCVLPSRLSSGVICQLVADLYVKAGEEQWGEEYDMVLGGGFLKVRNPYNLSAGEVRYRDLQAILPFDNEIVLCSISGAKLLSQFINTTNSDYFISMSAYGKSISIDPNATYYIVVDTYTSTYRYNGLTEVARYQLGVYARDLLAEYLKENY